MMDIKQEKTGSLNTGEPEFLQVGHLQRSHGVDGEIAMRVVTDFPERLRKGKTVYLGEAHKVREVWIQWTDEPDTWIDISTTVDLKEKALLQHKSQVGEDVVKMVRDWAMEAGKGLAPAETYKVIYLEKRPEAEAQQQQDEKLEEAVEKITAENS